MCVVLCIMCDCVQCCVCYVSSADTQFNSDIFGTFSIHTSTEFSCLQMEIYSRTSVLRLARCAATQRWWCACGPEFPPPLKSNLAKNKRNILIFFATDFLPFSSYLACMIYKTGSISAHRRVHHQIFVNLEHVTANATTIVVTFTFVRQRWSNQFASILNDHFT